MGLGVSGVVVSGGGGGGGGAAVLLQLSQAATALLVVAGVLTVSGVRQLRLAGLGEALRSSGEWLL